MSQSQRKRKSDTERRVIQRVDFFFLERKRKIENEEGVSSREGILHCRLNISDIGNQEQSRNHPIHRW